MLHLLIAAQESGEILRLHSALIENGFDCTTISPCSGLTEQINPRLLDLAMVEIDGYPVGSETSALASALKQNSSLPVIALLTGDVPDVIDNCLNIDDFLIRPYNIKELVLRIDRLIHRNGNVGNDEQIKCDNLTIDTARCEVIIEGKLVDLTFKEYELLKFLASNRGRVFSREALLNRVWGYDYYGGDRTVDVHIRRLRSKIEDSAHTFIETIRNIGYRFIKEM